MPPRNKNKGGSAPRAGMNRFLLLLTLVAAAAGVRFLVGFGMKALRGEAHVESTDPSQFETQAGPVETADNAKTPQEFVERSLKENPVIIFSKSYCGFSMRGKQVLAKHLGEDGFKIVELDQREDGPAIQDEMLKITGGRTVPRIFVYGQFIGGADDVTAKDASGELAALLKEKHLI